MVGNGGNPTRSASIGRTKADRVAFGELVEEEMGGSTLFTDDIDVDALILLGVLGGVPNQLKADGAKRESSAYLQRWGARGSSALSARDLFKKSTIREIADRIASGAEHQFMIVSIPASNSPAAWLTGSGNHPREKVVAMLEASGFASMSDTIEEVPDERRDADRFREEVFGDERARATVTRPMKDGRPRLRSDTGAAG